MTNRQKEWSWSLQRNTETSFTWIFELLYIKKNDDEHEKKADRLVTWYRFFSIPKQPWWQRKRLKQLQLNLATYVRANQDFCKKNLTLFLPAPPTTIPLRLHVIILRGGRGGNCGTVQCWSCGGPLLSDISWLPHCGGGGDHDSRLTWLEYEGFVAAVEDARESVGPFEVEKGGDGEDQEQADQ